MSLMVALHAGRYVLLATDHLVRTYPSPACSDSDAGVRDLRVPAKFVETPLGFLAGCGAYELVRRVEERVTKNPPATLDETLAVILDERAKAADWPGELGVQGQHATRWMLTLAYRAGSDDRMVVALYNPDLNERGWSFLNTAGTFFAPIRPASFDLYDAWLQAEVEICERNEDEISTLEHNAELLRELTRRYAAEPKPKSSAECTVAVHFLDGERWVSKMLQPDEPLEWLDPGARFDTVT